MNPKVNYIEAICLDDVLIQQQFSSIESRKDVDLTTKFGQIVSALPIIATNMADITGEKMTKVCSKNGAMSILHRFFNSIDENVAMYNLCVNGNIIPENVGVSIGVGEEEKKRAVALWNAGAKFFCIDVAHGAQDKVVEMTKWFRELFGNDNTLVVGNFSSPTEIKEFIKRLGEYKIPDAWKIGIGGGSVCKTRVMAGVGLPHFESILDCAEEFTCIADGGAREPGDVAKLLGAGAVAVMIGGMFSGTREAASTKVTKLYDGSESYSTYYAGSAYRSDSMLEESPWRGSEGGVVKPPYKGPTKFAIKRIENGIRSAFTYSGTKTLDEFRAKCLFRVVSGATLARNGVFAPGNVQS